MSANEGRLVRNTVLTISALVALRLVAAARSTSRLVPKQSGEWLN